MRASNSLKQISLFIPVDDWRRLRQAAADEQLPMTELCRRWLRPHFEELIPEKPGELEVCRNRQSA